MSQRGFTLLELVVTVAIGSVILLAITSSLYQIEMGKWQIAGKSIAMTDIDNAAHWLIRDIAMAQQVTGPIDPAPSSENMVLVCNDYTAWATDEGSVLHSVSYNHTGTKLLRDYDGEVTTVGKYLTTVDFSISGMMMTVTLTASPTGKTRDRVTKRYIICMRSLVSY